MEARIGLIKNGLKNLEEGPVKNKKQRVEMMKNAMNFNTFIAQLIKNIMLHFVKLRFLILYVISC